MYRAPVLTNFADARGVKALLEALHISAVFESVDLRLEHDLHLGGLMHPARVEEQQSRQLPGRCCRSLTPIPKGAKTNSQVVVV